MALPATGAGPLRHRITLEQRSDEQGASGEIADVWTEFASRVPAALEMLKGRDVHLAQGAQNRVTTRFRIRYRDGVVPSMRVRWDGDGDSLGDRLYHIHFVERVDGRKVWMILLAEELVGTSA